MRIIASGAARRIRKLRGRCDMACHAAWAGRYLERFGFALVPLRGKAPYREAWNSDASLIRDADAARAHWRLHPSENIGACLGPSGLVSIDCDHPDGARAVLANEGIDLDALIER